MTPPPDRAAAEQLRMRLRDGRRRIDAARDKGFDVSSREQAWNALQHQYEQMMDLIFTPQEDPHGHETAR